MTNSRHIGENVRLPGPRMPKSYVPRLDAIAVALAATVPGLRATRLDAMRAALVAGIVAEEARLGLNAEAAPQVPEAKPAKPAAKRQKGGRRPRKG